MVNIIVPGLVMLMLKKTNYTGLLYLFFDCNQKLSTAFSGNFDKHATQF